MRRFVRKFQASSGCCSVGSLPISRTAGAVIVSRSVAVMFCLPAIAFEGWIVSRAVMVDIVRSQNGTSELLQQVVLFVCRSVGADYADRLAALTIANLLEAAGN